MIVVLFPESPILLTSAPDRLPLGQFSEFGQNLFVDQKHPGTVEYRGKSVKLTSKQFWLLSALAESPGKCVPYNTIYEKVWGSDVLVEMQQISYHKAQLLKKIQKTASKAEVKSLITPVSGEGMVLNLRPEEIIRGRN